MSKFSPVKHAFLDAAPHVLLSLTDADGLLTLELRGTNRRTISICFDGHIYYNKMDEGDALRTLALLKQDSCLGFTLIEARCSNLLDWFVEESFGVRAVDSLYHYVVLTEDDVVNVVSLDAPQITGGCQRSCRCAKKESDRRSLYMLYP